MSPKVDGIAQNREIFKPKVIEPKVQNNQAIENRFTNETDKNLFLQQNNLRAETLKSSILAKFAGGCFLLVLILCNFSCRMKTYSKVGEIPVPPESRDINVNAEDKTKLLNAMNFIVTQLKEHHTKIEDAIYQIPQNTDWQKIENFYEAKLTQSGWKKSGVTERGTDYVIGIWKSENFSGKQSIAVAVIDASIAENRNTKYLVVFLAEQ